MRAKGDDVKTTDAIVDLKDYDKVFIGRQFSVGLRPRAREDRHVCFTILSEDDGTWFISSGRGSSTYWLPSLLQVLEEANVWCASHCDPDEADGKVCGWKFR